MSVIPGNMIEPDDTVAFRQSGIPSTERKVPVEPSTPDASSVNASILTSDCCIVSDEIESKVLVIYTGGTIGMVKNAEGGNQVILLQGILTQILVYSFLNPFSI